MRPSGLFIGRATIDIIGLVERFPQADDKISARETSIVAGGPALNAAITFAHLGGEVTLVASFGTSGLGAMAAAECRDFGVRVVDLAAEHAHPFPVSIVISARQGASRCIVNAPEAASHACRPQPAQSPQPAPDIVLLDQFEVEAAETLVPRLRDAGVPIVLDGGGWKPVSPRFLHLATIPIVSSRFGPPGRCGPELFQDGRFRRWAITCGAEGAAYGEDAHRGHVAAPAVAAVDTLAAGDIFHGAFCFAYATRRCFAESLRFAADIAAKSCRFAGPRAWMRQDLES